MLPQVRCVLQHWYELRPKGQPMGSANNKRYIALSACARRYRRQGMDALRGDILSAMRGHKPFEAPFLPVGAGLFRDEEFLHAVSKHIVHALVGGPWAVEATYAAAFLDGVSQVDVLLSERIMTGSAVSGLVMQAAQEVLEIRADTKHGGKCRRCNNEGCNNALASQVWMPARV